MLDKPTTTNNHIMAGRSSMSELLEDIDLRFSKKYYWSEIINGQRCFVSSTGAVFHFIILVPFRTLVVTYAENRMDAYNNIFEDGDQFNIDQDFESLISEINEELIIEAGTDSDLKEFIKSNTRTADGDNFITFCNNVSNSTPKPRLAKTKADINAYISLHYEPSHYSYDFDFDYECEDICEAKGKVR